MAGSEESEVIAYLAPVDIRGTPLLFRHRRCGTIPLDTALYEPETFYHRVDCSRRVKGQRVLAHELKRCVFSAESAVIIHKSGYHLLARRTRIDQYRYLLLPVTAPQHGGNQAPYPFHYPGRHLPSGGIRRGVIVHCILLKVGSNKIPVIEVDFHISFLLLATAGQLHCI